ncbi:MULTISPECIES: PTS cellobiose transporter subunit IIC [Vibrio]|uniref:PTS cellobiose transporter subunit IIC n=1 Tax=Vibrio TaxID=662 RepID=UPI0002EEED6D|nr:MULTISPECIES: PTS cellobiose transporter subunit IIC [Vibrio]CAK2467119.1 Permease IIC component [Vibrio crassostreae]MCW4438926.1 PTS cellobiose transporter subunit IIC [Vibrio splendidus]MDH5877802.1 PTS cellobiose transporter subunit IIC [Vibrio sp. S/42/10]OEE13663.1 PTS cellobiose transporter subunit IIC [Vibrio cyclitrophicus ZF205]PMF37897.1 PTS cellobiose transporter subunit IIC [Vibrio cyclitrophicus]
MSNPFFDFIENKIAPVAGAFASQRHVSAMRDGFIGGMPFMIVGSFLLVFAFPPFSPDTSFVFGQWWISMSQEYFDQIMTPFNMTMGIMSCYISVGIAYNLANHYKLDALPTGLLSLMTFLLVAAPMEGGKLSASFMGGTGIFTSIIVSIYVTELTRFLKVRNIGIKLPEQVPAKIRQSFDLLIPALVVIFTIYPLNLFLQGQLDMILPAAIMSLFAPLISASDSLPAILLAAFLAHALWFAGIHGAAIVGGIMAPFWLVNLGLNQDALAAGVELPATFIEPFWSFFITLGGSGATFALVLLYLRSKSVHLRSIGKLCAVPTLFNINEPVIFGSPIVMNPILFIPFVGTPMINATIAYIAVQTDLIGKTISLVPWTAPAPIGAAWGAGWEMSNSLLVVGLILLDLVIYYPFFKIYEKQLVAEESPSEDEKTINEPNYA